MLTVWFAKAFGKSLLRASFVDVGYILSSLGISIRTAVIRLCLAGKKRGKENEKATEVRGQQNCFLT